MAAAEKKCYGTSTSPTAQPTASPVDGLCCGCQVETPALPGCAADALCAAEVGAVDVDPYCVDSEWDETCVKLAAQRCKAATATPAPVVGEAASEKEELVDTIWKFAIVILVMAILVISCFCVLLRIRRMYREHDRKRKIMRRNSEKYKRNKKLRKKKSLERAKTDGLGFHDASERKHKPRGRRQKRAKYHGLEPDDGQGVVGLGHGMAGMAMGVPMGAHGPLRVQTESTFGTTSPSMRAKRMRRAVSGKGARSKSPPRGLYGTSQRGYYGQVGAMNTTAVMAERGVTTGLGVGMGHGYGGYAGHAAHTGMYRDTRQASHEHDEESGSDLDDDEMGDIMKGLNRLQSVKRHSI